MLLSGTDMTEPLKNSLGPDVPARIADTIAWSCSDADASRDRLILFSRNASDVLGTRLVGSVE